MDVTVIKEQKPNAMNSETEAIRQDIRAYIKKVVYVEADKISDSSLIFKEGFMDSMGFIVLITFLEEEFSIKTNDDDLLEENFESINAITDFVIRKKGS